MHAQQPRSSSTCEPDALRRCASCASNPLVITLPMVACRQRICNWQLWHAALLNRRIGPQRARLLLLYAVLLCLERCDERGIHQAVHLLRTGVGKMLQDGVQLCPCR